MNKPDKDDYRMLIENEWKDLHHSRIQEWSALGAITAAHFGIITFLDYVRGFDLSKSNLLAIAWTALLVAIFLAVLGGLLTMRHRRLMVIKFDWIYNAEFQLGLIKTKENPEGVIPENQLDHKTQKGWRGLLFPRLLSTSGLMILFYAGLIILDILILVVFSRIF